MVRKEHFRPESIATTSIEQAAIAAAARQDEDGGSLLLNCSRGKREEEKKFLLQSTILRKLLIAITTLRLTIAATTSTSASSLSALLKALLSGCYYIIAFSSILLILIYINHVATQQQQQQQTTRQPASSKLLLSNHPPPSIYQAALLTSGAMLALTRNKRSVGAKALDAESFESERRSQRVDSLGERNSPRANTKPLAEVAPTKTISSNNKNYYRLAETNKFRSDVLNGQPDQQQQEPKNQFNRNRHHNHHQSATYSQRMNEAHNRAATDKSRNVLTGNNRYNNDNNLLPELSERHAGPSTGQSTYSANNRGAIIRNSNNSNLIDSTIGQNTGQRQQQAAALAEPTPSIDNNNNQWIPIAANQINHHLVQPQPINYNNRNNLHARKPQALPLPPPPQPDMAVVGSTRLLAAAPTTTIDIIDTNYPFEEELAADHRHYHHHHHHHHHHDHENQLRPPQHHQGRHWRRPRLNYGFNHERPSKMYKKVLLCDKTLVSLDYIRNFDSEPRPFYHFDGNQFNNKEDENVIELDSSKSESIFIDKRSPVSAQSLSNGTGNDLNKLESYEFESIDANDNRRAYRPYYNHYLNDDDPLVKCDMWDLEKGIKNRKPPIDILRQAIRTDFDTVRDAINRCRQLSEKTLPPDDEFNRDSIEIPISSEDLLSLFSVKRGLLPGTKWCGLGDQASSYNDLGSKHRIDICCRAHDHCPIRLKPFRNDYGVLNIALYTKSHCDCDADFYRCLREVHSRTADMLGNLYFNVMKLQCMREERMKVCREMKPIALGFERCVKYEESPYKTVFKFTTPPVAY